MKGWLWLSVGFVVGINLMMLLALVWATAIVGQVYTYETCEEIVDKHDNYNSTVEFVQRSSCGDLVDEYYYTINEAKKKSEVRQDE